MRSDRLHLGRLRPSLLLFYLVFGLVTGGCATFRSSDQPEAGAKTSAANPSGRFPGSDPPQMRMPDADDPSPTRRGSGPPAAPPPTWTGSRQDPSGDPGAPPPLAASPLFSPDESGYRLQAGDPVLVIMRGTEQTRVEDVLDPEGYIVLPFIGRMKVSGLTPSELEFMITDAYVPDYFRYLTVTVLIQTQRSFYVKGEVRSPTRYPYVQGMTLLRAVAAAGGPTDFANQKRVTISRRDQVLGPFSLIEILKDPTKDPLIEPDDVIDVPQKPW